ncbi:hypothetical protein [Trebonia sp.]|nr:hypothetical protein [Trebonia sp.]
MKKLYYREGGRYRRYHPERSGISMTGVLKLLLLLALIMVLTSLLR